MSEFLRRIGDSDVKVVESPDGKETVYELTTAKDCKTANVSLAEIRENRPHHHKERTEFYYILAGKGAVEIGDEKLYVEKGDLVIIPPLTRHHAYSYDKNPMRVLVVCSPAYDSMDVHDERGV